MSVYDLLNGYASTKVYEISRYCAGNPEHGSHTVTIFSNKQDAEEFCAKANTLEPGYDIYSVIETSIYTK